MAIWSTSQGRAPVVGASPTTSTSGTARLRGLGERGEVFVNPAP
jgi:hypothetical protein